MSSIRVNINGVTLSLGNVKKCASNVGNVATSIRNVKDNIDDQVAARRNIRRRLMNLCIDLEEINNKLERIYAFGNNAMAQYEDAEKTIKDLMITHGLAKQNTSVKDIVTDIIKSVVGLKYLKQIAVGAVKVVPQFAASFKEAMQPGGNLYKVFQVGKQAFKFSVKTFCKSVLAFSPIVMLVKGGLPYYRQQLNNLKTGAIAMGKKVTAWFKENVQIGKWINKAWEFGKAAISSAGKVIKNVVLSGVSSYIAFKKYQLEQLKMGISIVTKGAVAVFKKIVDSKPFKIGVAVLGIVASIGIVTAGISAIASSLGAATIFGALTGALKGVALFLLGANDVVSNVWDLVCIGDNDIANYVEFDVIKLCLVNAGYELGGQKGAKIAGIIDTTKDVMLGLVNAGCVWDDVAKMDHYAYTAKNCLRRYKQASETLRKNWRYTNRALGLVTTYTYKTVSAPIEFLNSVKEGELCVFESTGGKIVNAVWRVTKEETDILSF